MKQWIIIVNVYAASKKAGLLWRRAERLMRKRGIAYQCRFTGTDGNACELARKAAEQGYRRIVAVGGDGTVHDVLNGIMNHIDNEKSSGKDVSLDEFTLAVLPMGSGNDWIRSTGVPRSVNGAISLLESESFIRQDIVRASLLEADGSVKSFSYMVNIGGVGIDAAKHYVTYITRKPRYFCRKRECPWEPPGWYKKSSVGRLVLKPPKWYGIERLNIMLDRQYFHGGLKAARPTETANR